jgi:bifunctional ADP-heptose synthase (sugar kinase/adenylyltransferase)
MNSVKEISLEQKLERFIDRVSGLRVAVIGETIQDVFIDVAYEGHSMKSFCPVFRLMEGKEPNVQEGGTSAIAAHLRDFVKHVELISNTRGEIVKTRYVDTFDRKKHVEINKFDKSGFGPLNIDTGDYDVVIVADFGHGFCDQLHINDGFHLMCQTNSNNFGFNRASKWKQHRKRSVIIDLREASLQMNRSLDGKSDKDLHDLYHYELNAEQVVITLGSKGSAHANGSTVNRFSAYKSEIVDTIGAGDTFFAFACLAIHLDGSQADLTIPSLAAALSTTWLCNEQSVTKSNIIPYAHKQLH